MSIVPSSVGFRFTLDIKVLEPPQNGLNAYSYEEEAYRSGLYATLEEATAAALDAYPWIKDAETKDAEAE